MPLGGRSVAALKGKEMLFGAVVAVAQQDGNMRDQPPMRGSAFG
jgi:hypothetical protein